MSDVPLDSGSGEWIIVCSEDTFTALTGITDYKIIEVQASTDISGQKPLLTLSLAALPGLYQGYSCTVFSLKCLLILIGGRSGNRRYWFLP